MKRLIVAVLLAAISSTSPVSGQPAQLPAQLKLPLLIKVLSFDRDLERRSGDVVVAVVFQRHVPASLRERDDWIDAAGTRPNLKTSQVDVVAVEYQNVDQLIGALRSVRATVVFLPQLRAVDMGALADQLRAAGFRTATDDATLAGRSAAVGLLLRAGRAHVTINKTLALREGSDYSSRLLRVVEVFR